MSKSLPETPKEATSDKMQYSKYSTATSANTLKHHPNPKKLNSTYYLTTARRGHPKSRSIARVVAVNEVDPRWSRTRTCPRESRPIDTGCRWCSSGGDGGLVDRFPSAQCSEYELGGRSRPEMRNSRMSTFLYNNNANKTIRNAITSIPQDSRQGVSFLKEIPFETND